MKKQIIVVAALMITTLVLPTGAAAEEAGTVKEALSADEIMTRAWWAVKIDGVEAVMTLAIFNKKGQSRVRKMATVSKLFNAGQTEKRLIRFIEPADVKNTGLLTYDYEKKDDDIWFYMPAQRKTRRIVSSDKAKSFMGSEFTYADITPPAVEDFDHKITGTGEVEGVDCWIIESTPKNEEIEEENGYSRRTGHIGKADFMVRKASFYDFDGELHRELTVHDVREIDTNKHRYRAMHMVMENRQDGRSSEVKIDAIQLKIDIKDDYFTTRYLERE